MLEKLVLTLTGAAALTREKAENLVAELIAKGQLQAKDKNAMVSRLLREAKAADAKIEKKMKEVAADMVKGSLKQIDLLNKKLTKLSSQLEAAKKQNRKK